MAHPSNADQTPLKSDKLMTCKTCGKDIAKSAKACPFCGAKNKVLHPVRGALAGIIALIICIIIISLCGNPDTSTNDNLKDTDAQANTPAPIEISATSLWKAYSENKVNADNLYKDKKVLLTGTISDIGQDVLTKAPCISLEVDDEFGLYPIQCFFPKSSEQNDVIATLTDGQVITIIGNCDGTPLLNVQISKCYLPD